MKLGYDFPMDPVADNKEQSSGKMECLGMRHLATQSLPSQEPQDRIVISSGHQV